MGPNRVRHSYDQGPGRGGEIIGKIVGVFIDDNYYLIEDVEIQEIAVGTKVELSWSSEPNDDIKKQCERQIEDLRKRHIIFRESLERPENLKEALERLEAEALDNE